MFLTVTPNVPNQLYDLPPEERTEEVLHNLFRGVWLKQRDKYQQEIFPSIEQQRQFGLEGLRLLSNYFRVSRRWGYSYRHGRLTTTTTTAATTLTTTLTTTTTTTTTTTAAAATTTFYFSFCSALSSPVPSPCHDS